MAGRDRAAGGLCPGSLARSGRMPRPPGCRRRPPARDPQSPPPRRPRTTPAPPPGNSRSRLRASGAGNPPFYEVYRRAVLRPAGQRRLPGAGRGLLVRRAIPRQAHVERRDLRHARVHGRPQDAAAALPRPGHESGHRAERGGDGQRPGSLRKEPADRPLLCSGEGTRHRQVRHGPRRGRGRGRSELTRPPEQWLPGQVAAQRLFLQVGAFSDEANASRLKGNLESNGVNNVVIRYDDEVSPALYRVRIGPLTGSAEYDALASRMASLEIANPRLVTESPPTPVGAPSGATRRFP